MGMGRIRERVRERIDRVMGWEMKGGWGGDRQQGTGWPEMS